MRCSDQRPLADRNLLPDVVIRRRTPCKSLAGLYAISPAPCRQLQPAPVMPPATRDSRPERIALQFARPCIRHPVASTGTQHATARCMTSPSAVAEQPGCACCTLAEQPACHGWQRYRCVESITGGDMATRGAMCIHICGDTANMPLCRADTKRAAGAPCRLWPHRAALATRG